MQQKRWSLLGALVLGVAVSGLVTDARADDKKAKEVKKTIAPTGTYTWERRSRRDDRLTKRTLTLKFEGGKLTGTYDRGRGEPSKIESGKVDGDTISFEITRSFNDRNFTIKYRGKVTAGGIEGTIEFPSRDGQSRSRPWEAKRTVSLADALGLWKFKIERDNGETMETSLTISKAGDKLKGLYKGPRSELEVKDISLKEGVLSFVVSRETDNGEFRATYKGKLSGNSIKGKIEYRFGDREGTVDFVGQREGGKVVQLASVVGTWKLEVTRDNGETRESTIALKLVDGKLKDLYTSRYGEREAEKITLKGDALSFQLSGETDNGSFLVVYKGKVSANTFKGTSTYEFGERKGTRNFVGRRAEVKKERL